MEIRKIKALLAKEFGYKNVSVRKGTGTASGWLYIIVYTKESEEIFKQAISSTVQYLLRSSGLYEQIPTYYDDFGFPHKQLVIEVIEQ